MKFPLGSGWLALALGITALIAAVLMTVGRWIHVPQPVKHRENTASTVTIMAAGQTSRGKVLLQEHELLDPTPLFLPTPRSFSQLEIPAVVRREPGENYSAYPAVFTYASDRFDVQLKDPNRLALDRGGYAPSRIGQASTPFAVLGRGRNTGEGEASMSTTRVMIEAIRMPAGTLALTEYLTIPALAGGHVFEWEPYELAAAITPSGIIGQPVLASSSGSDLLDNLVSAYITKSFRIGERLAPGFYIFRVGP